VPPPQSAATPARTRARDAAAGRSRAAGFSSPTAARAVAPATPTVAAADAGCAEDHISGSVQCRALQSRVCQRSLDAALTAEKPKHLIAEQIVFGCSREWLH
jgi:hypothetical protein